MNARPPEARPHVVRRRGKDLLEPCSVSSCAANASRALSCSATSRASAGIQSLRLVMAASSATSSSGSAASSARSAATTLSCASRSAASSAHFAPPGSARRRRVAAVAAMMSTCVIRTRAREPLEQTRSRDDPVVGVDRPRAQDAPSVNRDLSRPQRVGPVIACVATRAPPSRTATAPGPTTRRTPTAVRRARRQRVIGAGFPAAEIRASRNADPRSRRPRTDGSTTARTIGHAPCCLDWVIGACRLSAKRAIREGSLTPRMPAVRPLDRIPRMRHDALHRDAPGAQPPIGFEPERRRGDLRLRVGAPGRVALDEVGITRLVRRRARRPCCPATPSARRRPRGSAAARRRGRSVRARSWRRPARARRRSAAAWADAPSRH